MFLKKIIIIIPLLLSLIAGSFHSAFAVTAQSGPYEVQLTTDPAVVPVGKAQLIITLRSHGKPVTDATVKALAAMPDMPMGEREALAKPRPGEPGVYVAPAGFSMAGAYEVALEIDAAAGKASLQIPLQTGQNTVESGGFPWASIIVALLLLAAIAFALYRIKATGQRIPIKEAFRPATVIGIVALVAIFFLAVYAVRKWRRPGAMTPVQMMGMAMETPAPAGVLPVRLATVKRGNIHDQVVYTGQAVGYIEQNIYPRVDGVIEWMPLYAGDKIKKGQLLARLDTSEYDPEVAAQQAAAAAARQQVGIAQSNSAAAQSQASEAQAQIAAQSNRVAQARHQAAEAKAAIAQKQGALKAVHSQSAEARSSLQEAQNNYQAQLAAQRQAQSDITVAQQAQEAAQAKVAAAKTRIDAAQAGVASAQADVEYWKTELPRMKALLEGDAVSRQAYESEVAQSKRCQSAGARRTGYIAIGAG